MISPVTLATLYREACELELQAFKPGNVSVYADGHDMTVADFRISAEASADSLCNPAYTLGEKIYSAVEETRTAVGCNTNLGIILLCAPLIHAVETGQGNLTLRENLANTLASTTVDDANLVFKAISLASPGGLGNADAQDVHGTASENLLNVMKLAASRDRIALQYSTNFADIFELSLNLYYNAIRGRIGRKWAAVIVYVELLRRFPDSHIVRKYGSQFTGMVQARMAEVGDALAAAERPEDVFPLFFRIDRELKSLGVNPGTTADLTVATLFTALLEEKLNL